jgi:hypothetical protein
MRFKFRELEEETENIVRLEDERRRLEVEREARELNRNATGLSPELEAKYLALFETGDFFYTK